MSNTVEFNRGEEHLILYYFTSQIVPYGKHNINSYNCGHCKIDNITDLSSSPKSLDKFRSKTLDDPFVREDIISNIYPLEIRFLENIRFKETNSTDQILYQQPYESYVQELSINEATNTDDIQFHSFEIKIYDKIVYIWYFHVLLFWDTHVIQSKIKSNIKTYNTRKGIILVTEQPCFNFCYHLLKNLYNKTMKLPKGICSNDKLKIIMNSLNKIKVKKNRLNMITVSCENNENILNEYPLAIRSHFRLIDINLYYLFNLFTLEDILFFLSCFRMKVNLVFISNDHELLYPLHFFFANLFYPFTGDTDYSFYKTSSEFLFKRSLPKMFIYYYYIEHKSKSQTKNENPSSKGNDSPFNYVSLQFEHDKDVNQIGMIHLHRNKETKKTTIKKEFYFKFGSLDAKDKKGITGKPDNINDNSIITRVLSFKNSIALDKIYNEIMKLVNIGKDKEYDSFYGYDPKDNLVFMKISEMFFKLVCVFNEELVSELFLDASQLVLNVKLNNFEYEKDLLHEGIVINTYMDYKYFNVGNELSLFEINTYYLKYRKKKYSSILKINFSNLKEEQIDITINTNNTNMIANNIIKENDIPIENEYAKETIFKICFSPYECFDFFVQNDFFKFKNISTSNGFTNKELGIALYCMIRSIFLINYLNPIPPFLYLINQNDPLKVSKNEIKTLFNFLKNTKGFGIIIPPFTSILYLYFYFNLYERKNCVRCSSCQNDYHCMSVCKSCQSCVGCGKDNKKYFSDSKKDVPHKIKDAQIEKCFKCLCQSIFQQEIVPYYFPLINLDDVFKTNHNHVSSKVSNDDFFLPTISTLLLFKDEVIKKIIKHVCYLNISNCESQIAEICLFDNNEHFHYSVSQIFINDNSYEMKCSICKEKLKLKVIEKDGKEYIYETIPTPNDIFLRVWEAIMSRQSILFGNDLNEKNMFDYSEWQSDYRLIMFYGKLLYAEYGGVMNNENVMKSLSTSQTFSSKKAIMESALK